MSDHFDGKRFFSPGAPPIANLGIVLRWWLSRQDRGHWPRWVEMAPTTPPRLPKDSPEVWVTWINHSTFLLQTPAGNFLTDPVFSRRTGPFGFFGPARVHAPGVPFEALPKIDTVLLSHDHYDHCDLPTLRRLTRRDAPSAIAPLGNEDLLRRAGFKHVTTLDWWEQTAISSKASVTVTPALHWSNRLSGQQCRRLWGGFFLTIGSIRLWFAGDTGYRENFFQKIPDKLGAPDLALIPIGAYEPRWLMRAQHCNPAEAVRIHQEVRAHRSVAMHWGCFRLTDEAREAPPRALAEALQETGVGPEQFHCLAPGETTPVAPV